MARYRKNVKRIDPRYFLDETIDRNDDGSALEEIETVSVGAGIEQFPEPEEEEDPLASHLGTSEETLLTLMRAREILDNYDSFADLKAAIPEIESDRDTARWVAAIKANPMYGSSGLKEAYEEPKEESLLRMLWDMLMTKKYDRPDESNPERPPDRDKVTEAKDPTPPALSQWEKLFPRAADALRAVLLALAGEEIPGLVKHDRTPEQRAIDQAELAQAKKSRGPQPEPSWGKFQEGKKNK